MMGLLGDLLRRARLRGLAEGQVQKVRAESLENKTHDDAERFQDYGFAANPVDGQGLVLSVAGHTIVLRMDRLAERPQLAAHEVCIWHKEGHKVMLKAGKVIEVECDEYIIKTKRYKLQASESASTTAPQIDLNGATGIDGGATFKQQATFDSDVAVNGATLKHKGKNVGYDHRHKDVVKGGDNTGYPV